MANKILNLDLSKDPDLPVFIYGRVGDEMMQTATVNITNHDQQKSLVGYVITFEGTINNKIKVFDSDNVKPIDLAKGTFEYTFPSAAFSLAGTYDRAYFSIAKGELRDTTGDFKIVVSSNADITAEEAETIITEYNRLVAKLNQAFKDSLEQMESDYSELESTIEGIKGDISELNIKINNYQESVQKTADEAVNTISTSVNNAISEITQAVDKALQKLEAGDFYTKAAADTKFQGYQSTPIMAQDWNTITQPGIYYVNNATGSNRPDLFATTMYGFLEVINNKFSSNATVQKFISFNNEICTRRYSGNPITWGAWEATAKTKDVVTLTKDQEISGAKDFAQTPTVGGKKLLTATEDWLSAFGSAEVPVTHGAYMLKLTNSGTKLFQAEGSSINYDSDKLTFTKAGVYELSFQTGVQGITGGVWRDIALLVDDSSGINKYDVMGDRFRLKTAGNLDWVHLNVLITLPLELGDRVRLRSNGDAVATAGLHAVRTMSIKKIG